MKKIICVIIGIISLSSQAQQELMENEWILHYLIVDGVTYDVPQPGQGVPPCGVGSSNPGVTFWENPIGKYNMVAIVSFDYFFNTEPFEADESTFTILENTGSVTLWGCECLCDIEDLHFAIYLNPNPSDRVFNYEVSTVQDQKNLIITSPEGNTAVYGNYALAVTDFQDSLPFFENTIGCSFKVNPSILAINNFTAVVYDIQGKEIDTFNSNNQKWNAEGLSSGPYIVKASVGSEKIVQKILVTHCR